MTIALNPDNFRDSKCWNSKRFILVSTKLSFAIFEQIIELHQADEKRAFARQIKINCFMLCSHLIYYRGVVKLLERWSGARLYRQNVPVVVQAWKSFSCEMSKLKCIGWALRTEEIVVKLTESFDHTLCRIHFRRADFRPHHWNRSCLLPWTERCSPFVPSLSL